jgi:Zn-dependent peptidase ImmA (M78 family)
MREAGFLVPGKIEMQVEVNPKLVQWALDRAEMEPLKAAERFPKIQAWLSQDSKPTLKQLEKFAQAVHAPIGYFFLPQPPDERVPIPDFRTKSNFRFGRPSPDLLDTIYLCQQRQEWYRDFARFEREEPLGFVGSAKVDDAVEEVAGRIRQTVNLNLEERRKVPTWDEALRRLIGQADDSGVLVMVNGVVGNNTHRHLNPDEFRGFALADNFAPLVFLNGADSKSAQMFTLAHELAHLWLGETSLNNPEASLVPDQKVERWCNLVAAEILVPLKVFKADYNPKAALAEELKRLCRLYKVSSLVILRRMRDTKGLSEEEFWKQYNAELERLKALAGGSGGNFHLTQAARASKRFARALVVSVLEGRSSFTEAFRLLGIKKLATFQEFGNSLGVGA